MALRPVLRQVLRRRVLRPDLRQVLRRRVLPLAKQEGHTSERETKLTTLTTVLYTTCGKILGRQRETESVCSPHCNSPRYGVRHRAPLLTGKLTRLRHLFPLLHPLSSRNAAAVPLPRLVLR